MGLNRADPVIFGGHAASGLRRFIGLSTSAIGSGGGSPGAQGIGRFDTHIRPRFDGEPELTRRRYTEAPEECWHVYYGDVHVGTIAIRVGNPQANAQTARPKPKCQFNWVYVFFHVTPTRPPFLFRQITRQDHSVRQLSKVKSKLGGKSAALLLSKLTHAPSVVRSSTTHSYVSDASTIILAG
jgi:hypothetical protein